MSLFGRRVLLTQNTESWWLSGGISPTDVAIVYQPIGATSLVDSYNDLSGNGNNAILGVAPSWAATTGWGFNGVNQYLDTGVIPTINNTTLIRFNNTSVGGTRALAGVFGTGSNYVLYNATSLGYAFRYLDAIRFILPDLIGNYVMGLAGVSGYLNGVNVATLTPTIATSPTKTMYVGAYRDSATGPNGHYIGNILAFVHYNVVLNPSEVTAVSTAMAALTA